MPPFLFLRGCAARGFLPKARRTLHDKAPGKAEHFAALAANFAQLRQKLPGPVCRPANLAGADFPAAHKIHV
jgi:hypothetical protein